MQSFSFTYAVSRGLEHLSFNMQETTLIFHVFETSLRRMLLDNGNLIAQCHSTVSLQCPHIGETAPLNITFMTMTEGTYTTSAHLRMLTLTLPKEKY
jgi:hypothetical protein